MGTQGVVSIRQGGEMAMKLVCDCNGMAARTLADAIRSLGQVPVFLEAPRMAQDAHYGCSGCLVVVTPIMVVVDTDAFKDYDALDGFKRYLETFDDPNFNPRWASGIAAYVEIVDF